MDYSIQLPTTPDCWDCVVRAERLGFSGAWFYDTALLNAELFTSMAVAATKTSEIKLYTGVLVPFYRSAPVAASALATLNALAPGRIGFGVSTGFTGRRTMGQKPVALGQMVRYIETVRGLLGGEVVEWGERGAEPKKVRFIDPDISRINIKDPIPLAISALGPKGRSVVAQQGAQWVCGPTVPEREKAEMGEMRREWEHHGRDVNDLHPICSIGGRVLNEGESATSELALAQAGPSASFLFHGAVEQEEFGAFIPGQFPFPAELEQYRKVYSAYEPADARYLSNHRGHLMFVRPDETYLTEHVVRALTLTGTKQELVKRLKGIAECGFREVLFRVVPDHEADMMEAFADVMAEVNR